jgi:hypothetical protein
MGMNFLYNMVSPVECLNLPGDELAKKYLQANAGAYPDALWDGKALRRKRAAIKMKDAATFRRLQAVSPEGLQNVTVPMGYGKLYTRDVREHAKERVLNLVGDIPSYGKIELGRMSGIHVHLITSKKLTIDGLYHKPIYALDGFAAYLAKPADSRASYWQDPVSNYWHPPQKEEKDIALATWIYARAEATLAAIRLSSMTFCSKIPRQRTLEGMNGHTG